MRPRVNRVYAYKAVVCHPKGIWQDMAGDFIRENVSQTTSPGVLKDAAKKVCGGVFPDARHIFILSVRLKATDFLT